MERRIKMYNKFEKARIIGARALQLRMGAPKLIKSKELYDTIKIAKKEFEKGVLKIGVKH